MTVNVYKSTDASAPNVLAGTIGTLITVLDACLVDGYGSKSAAGWTKAFSGTNKAAYKQGSGGGGLQFYLRVDDSLLAVQAKAVGYETMSDVDTGTGPFPTSGQLAAGTYFPKSVSDDAVVRPWMVIATNRAFYLYVHHDELDITASSAYKLMAFFGDITSYKSGDQYNCLILGNYASGVATNNFGTATGALNTQLPGHYLARAYTQIGGSVHVGKIIDYYRNGQSVIIGGAGGPTYATPYPDPMTGGMLLAPIYVTEGVSGYATVRGVMPGLWAPLHNLPGNHYDTFSGSGVFSGKTFTLLDATNGGNGRCRVAIETSNTW